MREEGTAIFLFDTSTHVLWAEEVAKEAGVPVAVIPAPEEADDNCGLAIQLRLVDSGTFIALLKDEGIPIKAHP